jgi:hypothetical protein
MNGFAVISKADEEDVRNRFPLSSKLWGVDKFLQPFKDRYIKFGEMECVDIKIPPGFEKGKVNRANNMGLRKYGCVVSRDYSINYNPFFYHSCLVRALDFFTVGLGCDLRLSEVVIADASTFEGKNIFRLLLPFARRIVLVTENKNDIIEEADYAMIRYGTSVAVIEDPVKAVERADAVVLSSQNIYHKCLLEKERPMLYIKFLQSPHTKWWFNDVDISYNKQEELETIYAQGYVDRHKMEPLWSSAEKEGFRIKNIKKCDIKIMER